MATVGAGALVAPGAGVSIELGLGRPTIKIGPPLSTQIGLVESELPPGGGFPVPHWHEDLYELFYVLEGEIDYLLGRQWRCAPAGTTVFIPAGTVHAFRNTSGRPARQLVAGPPGAVALITELGACPRERWEEVHERHRSHYAHGQPGEQPSGRAAASLPPAGVQAQRITLMNSTPGVVVIGAGPAGLAAAAELHRMGISAAVLEQADSVGASWRGRYDRLRLNTCRWTSRLPRSRYPAHTALFPSRDDVVSYLEDYAARHVPGVRAGTRVERIDRHPAGWELHTSAGPQAASQVIVVRHVIVATGHDHTPHMPSWPGRDRYAGRLLHAAAYRNARPFRGARVAVAGAGCSGLEIAYDLAEGGADRVRVCIRTQPNIMLRQPGGLPGDLPATALLRLPPRIADTQALLARRLTVGDLRQYGLTPPAEGIFTRLRREGKAPAIVDKQIIQAIRTRRIEITASIESLDQTSLVLTGGTRIEADVLIAATGYAPGLEPLAGHLGVLDQRGLPRRHGGEAAAPGLRFIGYLPRPGQIGQIGREARRAAQAIKNEI